MANSKKPIWSINDSNVLDKDYKHSIVLSNDSFIEKIASAGSNNDESYSRKENRVLKNPWKPVTGSMLAKGCKVKFTKTDTVDDGKAILERGICAGVDNGKPTLYKVFARTDYATPVSVTKLDTKSQRKDEFANAASLIGLGYYDAPGDVTFKDKTNYKKLLGLS